MRQLPNADAGPAKARLVRLRVATTGRLDAVLAADPEIGLSRTRLKALIEDGAVAIDGTPCRDPARTVSTGQRVAIDLPAACDPAPAGEDLQLSILYEDDDLIVIDKPPGMVVHPAPGHASGTLVNALIHHCGASLTGIGGVRRPGIVQRLDKDTSGVMVAAKTEAAMASLAAQFADHGRTGSLRRAYLAIVWGVLSRKRLLVEAPLGRSPANRLKRAVVRPDAPDARHAATEVELIESYRAGPGGAAIAAMVECRLKTGRTHQIRVHMAHIGHPVIGDRDYGAAMMTKAARLPEPAASFVRRFARQALHAWSLVFTHPQSGQILEFFSAPPADFRDLRDHLAASGGWHAPPPYANFM